MLCFIFHYILTDPWFSLNHSEGWCSFCSSDLPFEYLPTSTAPNMTATVKHIFNVDWCVQSSLRLSSCTNTGNHDGMKGFIYNVFFSSHWVLSLVYPWSIKKEERKTEKKREKRNQNWGRSLLEAFGTIVYLLAFVISTRAPTVTEKQMRLFINSVSPVCWAEIMCRVCARTFEVLYCFSGAKGIGCSCQSCMWVLD